MAAEAIVERAVDHLRAQSSFHSAMDAAHRQPSFPFIYLILLFLSMLIGIYTCEFCMY